MDNNEPNSSFGVFKPVGHVVISFPTQDCADQAADALAGAGIEGDDTIRRYTDREMLAQIDRDLQQASPLAAIGQELNLVMAHRELAERGYHWLVVRADDDEQAVEIADAARPFGAERAQHYGHFLIEELIEHSDDPQQVAESPDRGLDSSQPWERDKEPPR
jgi:hypothetical protein